MTNLSIVPKSRTVWFRMWIVVIVALVVPWQSLQTHAHWTRIRWVPFVSAPVTFPDVVGNVLLYVPFGYFAWDSGGRRRWVVSIVGAAALSFITEFSQIWGHGRFPSAQDMLMNVAGAALGVVVNRSSSRNHGK